MSKDFKKDLIDLVTRLKNKENFAFTRFSDGELYILQNKKIFIENEKCFLRGQEHSGYWGNEELKSFVPEENQSLREHLKKSFVHKQKNYFKGVCCKCCIGESDWKWQFVDLLDPSEDHLTWSNLLINGNYINFMQQEHKIQLEHIINLILMIKNMFYLQKVGEILMLYMVINWVLVNFGIFKVNQLPILL